MFFRSSVCLLSNSTNPYKVTSICKKCLQKLSWMKFVFFPIFGLVFVQLHGFSIDNPLGSFSCITSRLKTPLIPADRKVKKSKNVSRNSLIPYSTKQCLKCELSSEIQVQYVSISRKRLCFLSSSYCLNWLPQTALHLRLEANTCTNRLRRFSTFSFLKDTFRQNTIYQTSAWKSNNFQ